MENLENWFTVERLDAETYAISEYRHWEQTHCYVLLGSERALLIDTGLGVSDISEAVRKLTALPVTVATTHVHWDHIGGHRHFNNILVYEAEEPWLHGRFPLPREAVLRNLLKEPCSFPDSFDAGEYEIYQGAPSGILRDGDELRLGGRRFQVLHTPGHSPGHICFYEPERQYLFSGDLAYAGVLDMFYPTTDPKLFRESVERVRKLPVRRVFPGHHSLNVRPELLQEIGDAFSGLASEGHLHWGAGVFDFGNFALHL